MESAVGIPFIAILSRNLLEKNYNVCVCRVSIENFHTILILEYDQSNPSLMYNAKLLTGRCHFWHCWGTRLQVMVMNFVNN